MGTGKDEKLSLFNLRQKFRNGIGEIGFIGNVVACIFKIRDNSIMFFLVNHIPGAGYIRAVSHNEAGPVDAVSKICKLTDYLPVDQDSPVSPDSVYDLDGPPLCHDLQGFQHLPGIVFIADMIIDHGKFFLVDDLEPAFNAREA